MHKTDPVTERILTAAVLHHAQAGKKMDHATHLFCGAFSDMEENICQEMGRQTAADMTTKGWVIDKGQSVELSMEGRNALRKTKEAIAGTRRKLGGAITKCLSGACDKKQAEMFQGRMDSLFEMLDRMGRSQDLAAEARTLEAVLAFRIEQLLDRESENRTRFIRDMLDLTYSRAAIVKHSFEHPKAPKKLDPTLIQWEKIGSGLAHGRLWQQLRTGPVNVNILRINPKQWTLLMTDSSRLPLKDRDLPAICQAKGAVAGVSGGFFLYSESDIEPPCRQGDPVGLIVENGVVTNPPVFNRSTLLVDDKGHSFIHRMGMKGVTIGIEAVNFVAKKVNTLPQPGEIAVFTRVYGLSMPSGGKLQITIAGQEVAQVGEGPLPIPLNGFGVIVDPGTASMDVFEKIKAGSRVSYVLPKVKGCGKIIGAMAGGPLILSGTSRIAPDYEGEQFLPGIPPVTFAEDRSIGQSLLPRMAWGVNQRHELFCVAVDGRNFEHSVGLTLDRLASFMLRLGCVEAFNLDGGSSKRMVVKGQEVDHSSTTIVLDKKSETPKRAINSAMLILPR